VVIEPLRFHLLPAYRYVVSHMSNLAPPAGGTLGGYCPQDTLFPEALRWRQLPTLPLSAHNNRVHAYSRVSLSDSRRAESSCRITLSTP
jgi:hypothetical protein